MPLPSPNLDATAVDNMQVYLTENFDPLPGDRLSEVLDYGWHRLPRDRRKVVIRTNKVLQLFPANPALLGGVGSPANILNPGFPQGNGGGDDSPLDPSPGGGSAGQADGGGGGFSPPGG